MDNSDALVVSATPVPELSNSVILTIDGKDNIFTKEELGISFNDSSNTILAAVQGLIAESLQDNDENFVYTVRKSTDSQNIYIYPKSDAGN